MRIAVCIKQVPVVSAMTFDPATRTLKREGVRNEVSSFDVRALVLLLPSSPCGGRHQVLTGGIQQQHRRRINVEKPLHPLQQLNQKILNTQMGQCDIGDRLDPAQQLISRRCITRFV